MNNSKSNDVSVQDWDLLVIYTLANKLDEESRKSREEALGSLPAEDFPALRTFTKCLETKSRLVLEMIQTSSTTRVPRELLINQNHSLLQHLCRRLSSAPYVTQAMV